MQGIDGPTVDDTSHMPIFIYFIKTMIYWGSFKFFSIIINKLKSRNRQLVNKVD